MLVLLRGDGDEIVLVAPGLQDTRIRFLRCEDGCVRVGIEADAQVSIIRAELLNPQMRALRQHPYHPAPRTARPPRNPDQREEKSRWREEKRD